MKRICIILAAAAGCLWALGSNVQPFQSGPVPDFDEDGVVGFADFVQFAGRFGSSRGDETFDDRFDLDGDGAIGFPDFLIFAGNFGKASPYGGDENDVRIPDANLRAVIADSLGKARDEPITRAEMATLTELKAHEANIRDLSGLQFATNLEHLWLTYNPFSDVSALCDLTDLRTLVFYGNAISELSPLSGLTGLTDLHLNDNRISNIAPLAGLTHLTSLTLGGNEIRDVSAISGLNTLTHLALFRNGLSDISDLSGLIKLTELDLSENGIADISALSELTNLRSLNLSHNRIQECSSDISALANMINLTHLNLSHNRISDFSPLAANTGIDSGDEIDARNNPLTEESFSTHLPALRNRGANVQFDRLPAIAMCSSILPDDHSVDAGSSHTLQTSHLYIGHDGIRGGYLRGGIAAVAYADFNGDGHVDVFFAPSDGTQRDPIPVELYLNDGAGCFTLDTTFLGANPPGRLSPRKALPGDFNGDGRMDVFVLDHGYDKPPFPGAAPYLILSSEDGYVLGQGLEGLIGFHHGGASADIDADGDIDVFVTNSPFDAPFFLMNDGNGSFTQDAARIVGIRHDQLYTVELADVDGDGFLDLLAAGHEFDSVGSKFPTRILWGDRTNRYSTNRATILPAVTGRGIVVDIDVSDTDGDGDKDIVINRTGDERTTSYRGYFLQLVEQVGPRSFEDRTERLIDQHADKEADWIVWIRMCDCDADGDVDIVVDDAARNLIWKNDGTGAFRPR